MLQYIRLCVEMTSRIVVARKPLRPSPAIDATTIANISATTTSANAATTTNTNVCVLLFFFFWHCRYRRRPEVSSCDRLLTIAKSFDPQRLFAEKFVATGAQDLLL